MATSKTGIVKQNDEDQIRQLIEDWREALRIRDLDRLMQHYAPDVVFFDAVPPYQHRGAAAYRRTWEQMFPHLPPRIGVELRDLEISVSGDLAVMRCLTRIINEETKQDATCGWYRVLRAAARHLARHPRTCLRPIRPCNFTGRIHSRAVAKMDITPNAAQWWSLRAPR